MDNQHRQIKGYRELSQQEIDAMNEIKTMGAQIGALVEKLRAQDGLDQRWISIGATDMQKGLLALTRGVAWRNRRSSDRGTAARDAERGTAQPRGGTHRMVAAAVSRSRARGAGGGVPGSGGPVRAMVRQVAA